VFEFQLMPNLLNTLQLSGSIEESDKEKENEKEMDMEWLCVDIYTCSKDCHINEVCEEDIVVQLSV